MWIAGQAFGERRRRLEINFLRRTIAIFPERRCRVPYPIFPSFCFEVFDFQSYVTQILYLNSSSYLKKSEKLSN